MANQKQKLEQKIHQTDNFHAHDPFGLIQRLQRIINHTQEAASIVPKRDVKKRLRKRSANRCTNENFDLRFVFGDGSLRNATHKEN